MEIKFKMFEVDNTTTEPVLPKHMKEGDAGLDFTAVSVEYNKEHNVLIYDTAIGMEIPLGYEGCIRPRSSIYKKKLVLTNTPGTVDSNYRGKVKAIFRPVVHGFHSIADNIRYMNGKEGWQDFLEKGEFRYYANREDRGRMRYTSIPIYKPGERIFQMLIQPVEKVEPILVDELSETNRGEAGYGSSDN